MFRVHIIDCMMCKHSVSTQLITSVHLQVRLCKRLQYLLGLLESLAESDNDVLSLITILIIFCTQILGLEVTIPVNVEELPAIVLCSRSRNILRSSIGDTNDTTTKN